MEIKNFAELKDRVGHERKKTVAVACAHDEHTLEAVLKAHEEGILNYYLIGYKDEIIHKAKALGFEVRKEWIIEGVSEEECAGTAVCLVNENKADFIQKGLMQTSALLKAVVNKESGIGKGVPMSHIALLDIPGYHKIMGVTDGGMILYPDLEMKKAIIRNAVDIFWKAGYEKPKVAAMCAVEVVNPKMPETVDARALKKMSEEGMFGECYVEGPISMDIAVNRKAAQIKKCDSQVAGDVDILMMPDIDTGNIMVKALLEFAGAKMAGLVTGAKAPIALNSRSASFEEKYYSLMACSLMAG
ncbi:MAG: phosphate butyryltransferase [Dorea sp.]|jgi:phosphate butyryltransferase|nr:phosphate butyryltransferase [Dorea sp.]